MGELGMSSRIDTFTIGGLWGQYDVCIDIKDNLLVLVGENGTGKSTMLEIFYYYISGQWRQLTKYDFEKVSLTLFGEEHSLLQSDIDDIVQSSTTEQMKRVKRFHPRYRNVFERHSPLELADDPILFNRVVNQYGLQRGRLRDYMKILLRSQSNECEPNLFTCQKKNFDKSIGFDSIYLPTYRRIERSLDSLLKVSVHSYSDSNTIKDGLSSHSLVNFGMTDVNEKLTEMTKALGEDFRDKLNILTNSFFKDAIRERFTANKNTLKKFDEATIDATLRRVDDKILSDADKRKLKKDISVMKKKQRMSLHAKVKLSFFEGIHKAYSEQIEAESEIYQYMMLCNKYLVNKKFLFNNSTFTIMIVTENARLLDFEQLSSGEKQIVSLFTKLFFYKKKFVVFIDEPELSLSVPWQEYFLEDIKGLKNCAGIVAVTHSPFIFDNSLVDSVQSAKECMTVVDHA